MKKALSLTILAAMAGSAANAANVGVDVDIHVGNRPPAVAVPAPPPPVVAPAPPPPVVIQEPPEFILPPALGFYVSIGTPYDMFYIGSTYYLYRGGIWYRAPHYGGPWVATTYRSLPPGLRRHKYERIVRIRDEEYRRYRHDREHYRGRYFRPDKHEMKERRKEEKRAWKEEKREMKEERREEREQGRHGDH